MPSPSPTATAETLQNIISNPDYIKLGSLAVVGIFCIFGCLLAICLWKM